MTSHAQNTEALKRSNLFDAAWYALQYPDVTMLGIQPEEHYLRYGGRLLRDPSPTFSTRLYLEANPDVAAAGVNALLHYVEHGRRESRALTPQTVSPSLHAESIDVVVPVFNALEYVKKCLEAVRTRKDGFQLRCIVVNDGSNDETTEWLRKYSAEHCATFELIEHLGNRGYTQAVNTGLRASTAPYVVTLNSDTIVTRGWLRGLVRCMNADPTIGIVGPLSNAASWQNVPVLYDPIGAFAVNDLPLGMTADDMAAVVASASRRTYPRTPFVNGFCFMIRRSVIDTVGYMDEMNFPVGYGEENDFCIRAADAGFTLAIADDTFVFHAKSKSFGHERRKELSSQGSATLKRKHSDARFSSLIRQVKDTVPLDRVRALVTSNIQKSSSAHYAVDLMSMRILFLLPVRGGGGGANSVMQEVSAMQRIGVRAMVAVRSEDRQHILDVYSDIAEISCMVIGFENSTLATIADDFDVVVATIFTSMQLVKNIVEASPHILPAYYVQDYEPLFFPPDSESWRIARESYSLVSGAALFAKTEWIARKVLSEHGETVRKVEPSIDHDVFKPAPKPSDSRIHIAAMIRPQTPYRGAERTMRILSRLSKLHPRRLYIHVFGCNNDSPYFQGLTRDFEFHNHGNLRRPEVASVLAQSQIFVDFSDYQAFGRTSLEAMASGCAVLVPLNGGGDEYAIDGANSIVVDTFDEDECLARFSELVESPLKIERFRRAGLKTAARYSQHSAAVSELVLLAESLELHRKKHPVQTKPKALLMPSVRNDMVPAGSGYVRVVLPYTSASIRRNWRVELAARDRLPQPGDAEVIVIQREAPSFSIERYEQWLATWRAAGARLIYEIDDDLLNPEALTQRRYSGDAVALTQQVRWFALNADTVTVSTSPLASKLRLLGANVQLIPNRLDAGLWRLDHPRVHGAGPYARREDDGIVRIGYIGTATHDHDLELIAEAMRQIEIEYGDRVLIEIIGGFQNTAPSFGKRVPLPKKSDYPNFVNWLHKRVNWDIGVIPLVDDEFNRSKSNLKFLEYAALDMAIVCSDVESYRDLAQDGANCLVVANNSNSWYHALKRLIEDREMRQRLSSWARQQVRKEYTIEASSSMYLHALDLASETVRQEVEKVHAELTVTMPDSLFSLGVGLRE